MPVLTAWEQEWVRVQEELRQHPEVEVLHGVRGPLVAEEIPGCNPKRPTTRRLDSQDTP